MYKYLQQELQSWLSCQRELDFVEKLQARLALPKRIVHEFCLQWIF